MKKFKFIIPVLLTVLALCAIFACSDTQSSTEPPTNNTQNVLATTPSGQPPLSTTTADLTTPVITSTQTAVTTTTAVVTTAVTTQKQEEKPPVILSYTPSVPKATKQATLIYMIPEPGTFSDKLTLASLQGLAAKNCEEQILIMGGSYSIYQKHLTDNWNCKFTGALNGKATTVSGLIGHFMNSFDGYILCSADPSSPSGSVAVSLSGILNAVIVTPNNRKFCDDLGLECLIDVTDKDDNWLRSSEYFAKLNRSIAFEQPLEMAPKLVDYAVMSGSYFSFYNGHSESEHSEMYSFLDNGAIVFGYNNTLGEYGTVRSFSGENIQLIPSDHAFNLSTLSGFAINEAEQKTKDTNETTAPNKHSVCIILSDGDNMQWFLNDFATSGKWWNNSNRGKFNMGWGIPPTAIDVIAPMHTYLYDTMTEKDEFIMQISGLGYTFPSRWNPSELDKMTEKLAEYMKRNDIRYAEILDDNGFNAETLSHFTKHEEIEGLFYIDYANYAGKNGEIIWTNGKPAVAARYRLWANMEDGSISAIASAVNNASTDPTKSESYSFIIVHAWSGLSGTKIVPNGSTLNAISRLISNFDSDVEVLTPSQFMERIQNNIAR